MSAQVPEGPTVFSRAASAPGTHHPPASHLSPARGERIIPWKLYGRVSNPPSSDPSALSDYCTGTIYRALGPSESNPNSPGSNPGNSIPTKSSQTPKGSNAFSHLATFRTLLTLLASTPGTRPPTPPLSPEGAPEMSLSHLSHFSYPSHFIVIRPGLSTSAPSPASPRPAPGPRVGPIGRIEGSSAQRPPIPITRTSQTYVTQWTPADAGCPVTYR